MAGMFVHVFFVYTGIFYFITRDNPFGFLKFVLPAQTTAFACASSAATMPVSLACAEASGRVPKPIARFVIPLGATINMDGSAIYFPCACVWLAVLNGLTPTFANYIMLAILSTIGSAGTAPVPSAGLVMVLTAYNSVFNTTGVPDGFEFVVAIDWFLDRLQTVVNVTGDNVVAASISHMVSLEESDTTSRRDDEEVGSRQTHNGRMQPNTTRVAMDGSLDHGSQSRSSELKPSSIHAESIKAPMDRRHHLQRSLSK
eukprot:scaffold98_cov78-Cylindrotheca_fusiformis.AAC.2